MNYSLIIKFIFLGFSIMGAIYYPTVMVPLFCAITFMLFMEAIDNVERVNKLFPLPLRKAETDKTIIPKHPQSIDFEEIYIKVKRRMETDINISKSLPEQFSFVGSIYHVIRSKELSSEFMSNQTFPMIVVINKKTKELKLFSAELILDEMPDLLNEDK